MWRITDRLGFVYLFPISILPIGGTNEGTGGVLERRLNLFKKADKFFRFEVENVHVVKFFGNFENAAVNNHVVLVNLSSVATPGNRSIVDLYLSPDASLEVKFPDIIELRIVFAFASKDVHAVSIRSIVSYYR